MSSRQPYRLQLPNRLLRITEVAYYAAISRREAYRAAAKGRLATVRVGERSLRVHPDELRRFIAELDG